ncbi:MAG: hypothetical protein HC884_06160 [Chloroflexaceae bacterium]|nr:hypothetical protein [Chloroflexaceae bacterium]
MHPLPSHLRPMSMLDLLDGVFWTYRKGFLTFLGVVVLALLPFILIETVLSGYIQYGTFSDLIRAPISRSGFPFFSANMILAYAALFGVSLIQSIIVQPVMYGAIIWATAQRTQGVPISIRGAYGFGTRSMLSLIGASFLVLLITLVMVGVPYGIMVGALLYLTRISDSGEATALVIGVVITALILLLLALIALLLLTVKFLFVPQAIVLETTGPLNAFSRSWGLTRGSFWRVLAILLLVALVVVFLTFAIGMVNAFITVAAMFTAGTENPTLAAIAQAVSTLLNSIPTMVLFPIYGIGSTLLYYDLRLRKEGADLQARLESSA